MWQWHSPPRRALSTLIRIMGHASLGSTSQRIGICSHHRGGGGGGPASRTTRQRGATQQQQQQRQRHAAATQQRRSRHQLVVHDISRSLTAVLGVSIELSASAACPSLVRAGGCGNKEGGPPRRAGGGGRGTKTSGRYRETHRSSCTHGNSCSAPRWVTAPVARRSMANTA